MAKNFNFCLEHAHFFDLTQERVKDLYVYDGQLSFKEKKVDISIPFSNNMITYPGFINSYDCFLQTYDPISLKGQYTNLLSWVTMYQKSNQNKRYDLSIEELDLLGTIRNLISGVTLVFDRSFSFIASSKFKEKHSHSILKIQNIVTSDSFVHDYEQILESPEKHYYFLNQRKNNQIFVTHLASGCDSHSLKQFYFLLDNHYLNSKTVIGGGLNFKEKEIQMLADRQVNFIWTPSMHKNIFSSSIDVPLYKKHKINFCLGTDSMMSGSFSLLDEIRSGMRILKDHFDYDLDDRDIFEMISLNPAKAFGVQSGIFKDGMRANFVIAKKVVANPLENIKYLRLSDIMMVVANGRIQYIDECFSFLFEKISPNKTTVIVEDTVKHLFVRGAGKLLKKIQGQFTGLDISLG